MPLFDCPVNHTLLPSLFDPHVPNNPALWAVFNSRLSGMAVVDRLENPTQCVLRTVARLTYHSRQVSLPFLTAAIEHFKHTSLVWLTHLPGDPPAPEGYVAMPRLEFYDYPHFSPILADFRSRIPSGYDIRLIDKDLLDRCEWRDDMSFYCGSLDNFLLNGLGLCLMHGDEIIVEVYASSLGAPYAEIGVLTHAPYRGMGFAPITAAYLIEMLEQRGFHAYWSCDTDNPASAQVARKLGFLVERPYEILVYEPHPGSTQVDS